MLTLTLATLPSERHLSTVSGWLRTAVEQHLASQAAGADHLGALHEALRAAAFDGSDRRLVAVFAEALAVWHDIEVVGYVETAPGVFTRAVSLAGRGQQVPPLVFPPQAVPAAQRLTRMPQTHVDGADRGGAADALVVTLSRSAGSIWLLTLSGEIDACDPALSVRLCVGARRHPCIDHPRGQRPAWRWRWRATWPRCHTTPTAPSSARSTACATH